MNGLDYLLELLEDDENSTVEVINNEDRLIGILLGENGMSLTSFSKDSTDKKFKAIHLNRPAMKNLQLYLNKYFANKDMKVL